MNRKILILLFISFISVFLVVGFFGRIAIAQTRSSINEPSRYARAWEREITSIGGMQYITAHQYTSPYDLAKGEIYADVTYTYAAPDYARMMNPFAPQYESSYEASGTGGLFSGPMMRFPVSGMSWMMGEMGAPRIQTYQSQGLFTGSQNYQSIYQGLGLGTAGFMLGPFRNMWGGGGVGYPGSGGGYPGWGWGYPGISGAQTGGYPRILY